MSARTPNAARLSARPTYALLAAVLLFAAALGVRAQDDVPPAPAVRCEIVGVVTALTVRARDPRRRVVLDGVVARVAPIRHGLAEITATLADGTLVEGTSRRDVAVEVAGEVDAADGVLRLRAGAAVVDVEPIDGTTSAAIDVELAPRAVARGVVVPCASLRPVVPDAPRADVDPIAPGTPRWRPRVRDLHVRSGDDPARGTDLHVDVEDAELELGERARHRSWVRVAAGLPGGHLEGWVADTDLAPIR